MQDEDSIVESWVRALDLRDRNISGHARRVTNLTLLLARKIGINDEELVHIYRGALLHDIGKLGIPDAILFKPGLLASEEWQIMRQHPVYGHKVLSPIAFLKPALDIVYCHHEKWDGSGYPRGLRKDEIPLSARLFSFANVWDALITHQPYRQSWPGDAAIAYIKDQNGKIFDSQIVPAFLEALRNKVI